MRRRCCISRVGARIRDSCIDVMALLYVGASRGVCESSCKLRPSTRDLESTGYLRTCIGSGDGEQLHDFIKVLCTFGQLKPGHQGENKLLNDFKVDSMCTW